MTNYRPGIANRNSARPGIEPDARIENTARATGPITMLVS